MGMFDTIWWKGRDYQTKDLDSVLAAYRITDEGRFELVSDSDMCRSRIDCSNFTDKRFEFYGTELLTPDAKESTWVDYRAEFKQGQCLSLERRIQGVDEEFVHMDVEFGKKKLYKVHVPVRDAVLEVRVMAADREEALVLAEEECEDGNCDLYDFGEIRSSGIKIVD